jgi:hypothetical protein
MFGENHRTDFADILRGYYQLSYIRKPEYMEKGGDTGISITH